MEIKGGYSETQGLVTPEDWETKLVGDAFSVGGGFSSSRSQLSNDGYCYLHYGDIHGSKKQYIDVEREFESIPKLDINLRRISRDSLLADGDIVFVDASEDDEGASKHIVVRNRENIPFISGLHTIVLKSRDDSITNRYREYCFLTHDVRRQFKHYAVGTKVTGISKTNIKKIKVMVPTAESEQTTIATVLSNTDVLISNLEKLIAKKRNIKQGAMQLLLTGKKRLPGFSEKWEEKKAKEFGEVITGSTPSTSIEDYWNGDIPWVTPTDIKNKRDIYQTERQITTLGMNVIRKLSRNSLLVTCIASIGKNAILRMDGGCNQQINAIIPNKEHNIEYLYYLFEGNKQYLLGHAGTTATNIVSKRDFSEIAFSVPSLPEQTAIAKVLSDIDEEIEALERKLVKYKLIKQGMMQELLTGKKRLI